VTIVLTVLLFAIAGGIGAAGARVLCAARAPYDDGPQPIALPPGVFVVAAACLGLAVAWSGLPPAQVALLLAVVVALAGCSAADLACGALPDAFTLAPLVLVLSLAAFARDPMPALAAAFVALPFAAGALLSRGRGLGWGDVKLAALGGALLGAGGAALAFTLAALAAYAVARTTGSTRRPIAFGPYLAATIAITLPFVRTF
jgi:prepilin signal peptidase PulO-like enzyme (type II secretory pathway)